MSKTTDISVIGLTGQSGAGKTTVSKVFSEEGFADINADKIAREIMVKDSPCLKELAECFGSEIILENGELDRRKLAGIVFNDQEKLAQLNAISYPYITYEIMKKIKEYAGEGKRFVLLDAPTLFESRADDFCDLIISVTAPESVRTERIAKRDGISPEQIKERFSSQHSEKFFIDHSDFIIKNNKSVDDLIEKAREVADKVKEYCNNAEEAW
ncbi:MAG: dephospho-CoA kinase [Oscillospiraceae bacterium]|nr:dephospho-CoA kinase [Oscillospiraceae bacterium]